jgi:hypothetical protein
MRTFLFLILCFLFTACGTNGPSVSQNKAISDALKTARLADTLHHFDTVNCNNRKIVFTPIGNTEFDKTIDTGFVPSFVDGDCALLLKQDAEFISTRDSTIFIRCANGKKVVLTEHTHCDGDLYIEYTYGGKLDHSPFILFKVGYDEKLDYLIINLNSGKQIHTWGVPSLSPDAKYLISSSYDLDVGFLHNGIQAYRIGTDSLTFLWQQEFTTWGPEEVKWADKRTLFIKQASPDQQNKMEIVAYAKVKFDP